MRVPRPLVIVLVVLNAIVFIGQIWPEGAPPFARGVNIVVAFANIVVLGLFAGRGNRA